MSQGESLNVWVVRDGQGGRYGPIDFETLKEWVRDGRVGPANEVSKNGVDWLPAPQQRGLGMDWIAEIASGRFYGPIHRDAMRGLVEGGGIAGYAPLYHRVGDDADAMAFPPPDDEEGGTREERERLEGELEQALAKASAESQGHHGQSQPLASVRGADLQNLRQTFEAQAREAETHLEGEQVEEANAALRLAQERTEELEARLIRAEQERASTVRRFEEYVASLQARVETLEDGTRTLEDERRSLHLEIARTSSEADARLQHIVQMESVIEAARLETEAYAQRIAQMEAAAEASRLEAARQCNALEAKANDLVAKLAAAQTTLEEQRRLTKQERSRCAELQKSEESARSECDGTRARLERTAHDLDEARARLERATRDMDEARQEAERLRRAAPPAREVLEVEVLPPERPAAAPRTSPPPSPAPSSEPPMARPAHGGQGGKAAPSLADLERQARLELERLGAHGPAFFAKKK